MSNDHPPASKTKKRRSGIPTGNAGEYFVMGELLRRGYDAQLADRNTQGYDILVGLPDTQALHKVQVKSVRSAPWYVTASHYSGPLLAQVTIYVLVGASHAKKPVRYFLAFNHELAGEVHVPNGWPTNAFMSLKAIQPFEDRWDVLNTLVGAV